MAKQKTDRTTHAPRTRTRTKTVSAAVGASPAAADEVSQEHVALRAYHIFLSRGAAPGKDLDDWLQAERELRPS